MKHCLEQKLEKLESTSNDNKEKKSNINNFNNNKLRNMSNLLCVNERDKRYFYKRNKRLYFLFKINRKILEGSFGTHYIVYSYNYEFRDFSYRRVQYC